MVAWSPLEEVESERCSGEVSLALEPPPLRLLVASLLASMSLVCTFGAFARVFRFQNGLSALPHPLDSAMEAVGLFETKLLV